MHTKKLFRSAITVLTVIVFFFAATSPSLAQDRSSALDAAANFYLQTTCSALHHDDFVWDPAITVARWQGLQKGDPIPKDLLRVMKLTSNSDQQVGEKLLGYRWPTPETKRAIAEIANGFISDSKDIAKIAAENEWRSPNWSMWWEKEEEMLKKLGLSADASCPGWELSSFDAFRYLSAVCPANRAWKQFEKLRDMALKRGMRAGDSIPQNLKEEMLITALYLERSYGALDDFRSKDPRLNQLARAVALEDYQDSLALVRVAEGRKWQELSLAANGESANAIRRALKLPPVGLGSCPV